jgi:hypothetical protein
MCFDFLYNFVQTVSHYKKNLARYCHKYTALLVGGSWDRYPVVSLGIFYEATDETTCPGVDSASKNEYQENSWG